MQFPGILELEPIYPPPYLGLLLATYLQLYNSKSVLLILRLVRPIYAYTDLRQVAHVYVPF